MRGTLRSAAGERCLMQVNVDAASIPVGEGAGLLSEKEPLTPQKSWQEILKDVRQSEAFWPGVALTIGIALAFLPLWLFLPSIWGSKDGYYSHGPLVPLISGYIIYRNWPRIKDTPIIPSYWAMLAAVPLIILLRAAYSANIAFILSFGLLFTLLTAISFVAGWRWMLKLTAPVLYLAFCLPIWTMAFDTYTNPLQQVSTKVAYQMLALSGMHPYQPDPTTIYLNNFVLNVEVPCSGLKLVLAVTAFTIFFMLIARLKTWGNIGMAIFVVPLCLFINGLRIALIGVVGDMYGADAGHQFHDYSGYITLVLCFFILFKLARVLGWKD